MFRDIIQVHHYTSNRQRGWLPAATALSLLHPFLWILPASYLLPCTVVWVFLLQSFSCGIFVPCAVFHILFQTVITSTRNELGILYFLLTYLRRYGDAPAREKEPE